MKPERNYTQLTNDFLTQLPQYGFEQPSVVLIGSVARGSQTAASDLDLLVVAANKIRIAPIGPLHVQVIAEQRFRQRLQEGDDFAAWCVRFGIPLLNSPTWAAITNSPEALMWPDWRHKVTHATRRLLLAVSLLETEDRQAAQEETLYSASHAARGLLLSAGQFPLSRPEMIQQLADDHPTLSRMLNRLLYTELSEREISQSHRYIKKVLITMDRGKYRELVRGRSKKARASQ